jgi:hypothetical protein
MTEKTLDLMEEAMKLSQYHFDLDRHDPEFDQAIELGHFEVNWQDEIDTLIANATPKTFGNRNERSYINTHFRPIEKEFFDKTDLEYDNYIIIDKTDDVGPKVEALFEAFQLDPTNRARTVHVQRIGQVFPYHIDFFHRRRWGNADPSKVIRIAVHLNDWQPGQCMGYGNGVHTHWKAGDFHTFRHADTPHWTSNANYIPRVSLLVTGIMTAATEELLERAKTESIKIG